MTKEILITVTEHAAQAFSARSTTNHYGEGASRAAAISDCVAQMTKADDLLGQRWRVNGDNLAGTLARKVKQPRRRPVENSIFDDLGGKMHGHRRMKE